VRSASILIAFLSLSAVAYSAESPLVQESRPVKTATDPKKTVTVPEGMVWYDASRPTRGLRFPPGTYVLEAEDSDYLYFHSSAPLEMRLFKDGKIVDGHDIPGGIMLSKRLLTRIPAAGYIDDEGASKIMVWKLGKDFLRREGKDWKKSFK
jgi:hypothetical protein